MGNGYFKSWQGYLYASPCVIFLILFFITPIITAFYWSFHLESPFGGHAQYVGWGNYISLFEDGEFFNIIIRTIIYMVIAGVTVMTVSLALALAADRAIRGTTVAGNVLLWPKAFSVASVGVIFVFILDPRMGLMAPINEIYPDFWNPRTNVTHAWISLYIANIFGNIPFNFVILLAGLQAIPDTLHRAGALDGATPWRRLWDIQMPLITPQLFVTSLIEINQGLVSSFPLIETMTAGGPNDATVMITYKMYETGFVGLDLSGAAAQTMIVLLIGVTIALIQFKLFGKHIKYER